jgi:hypothetical protein
VKLYELDASIAQGRKINLGSLFRRLRHGLV